MFDFMKFASRIDAKALRERAGRLWQLEYPQTFQAYHAGASAAFEMLEASGIAAERIPFPADGKTAYQDKITPLGWDASTGRLTILRGAGFAPGEVIADYTKCPFHLIKGSVAAAPGGENVRIVTDARALAGTDVSGALVFVADRAALNGRLGMYLELGARGIVCDFVNLPHDAPDAVSWYNAFTEHGGWHVRAGDRDFIAFAVSPRIGSRLRAAAEAGHVVAHIESDGHRHVDTVDVVTGLVPGRRREEFWIFAHLYEPLANDNSTGVVAAIETARLIREQGAPEFSLRVVFGLEHYGFAAYAAHRGNRNLADAVIGAIDYDAMYLRPEWNVDFRAASPALGFYGNRLARRFCTELGGIQGMPQFLFRNSFEHMYDDDMFLGDSTTGIPTVWPIRTGKAFWHNSAQTLDYVDETHYARGAALHTAFVDAVVNPRPEWVAEFAADAVAELREEAALPGATRERLALRCEVLISDLENCRRFTGRAPDTKGLKTELERLTAGLSAPVAPDSPWRAYARSIRPRRSTVGLPFDLAEIPPADRHRLPGSVLYGPLAALLSDFDGRRDFTAAVTRVEAETRREVGDGEFKQLLDAVFYLAEHGYCDLNGFRGVTRPEIVAALRQTGIGEGDFLCVHSSLSAFGLIDGGAATVLAAFREAVGPEGTLLFPTFTDCFAWLGKPGQSTAFRPYDPQNYAAIWTGEIPRAALRGFHMLRSAHPTHSWCGAGPLAEAALGAQGMTDAPMAENSPMGFALRRGGKIVHFGSRLGATTFLHYIEDRLNLPGIEDCFGLLAQPGGGRTPVWLPRNLPYHRDFYDDRDGRSKFFRRAVERGLTPEYGRLGTGGIVVLDMRQLFEIGMAVAGADPAVMLCDDPECPDCPRLKRRLWRRD